MSFPEPGSPVVGAPPALHRNQGRPAPEQTSTADRIAPETGGSIATDSLVGRAVVAGLVTVAVAAGVLLRRHVRRERS